jgi:ComF family protein
MSVLDDLSNLLLPAKCVLCSRLPKPICQDCWPSNAFAVREVFKQDLRGYAICDYGNVIADLLNGFKDRGQVRIGQLLADQIPRLIERPIANALVFAPSSRSNFYARGFIPAKVIAERLGKAWSLPLVEIRLRSAAQDQADLDRRHRLENLVGTMEFRRPLSGRRVLLVDDIVTTGATLREMARAVGMAGGEVAGFITVAETLPKSSTKSTKKV